MYERTVEEIRKLPWPTLTTPDLNGLMILLAYDASEPPEALTLAAEMYPDSIELKSLIEAERRAEQLNFAGYPQSTSTASFLWQFIQDYDLETGRVEVTKIGLKHRQQVRKLGKLIRITSVLSRRKLLPGIFHAMLQAPASQWHTPALRACRHYLHKYKRLSRQQPVLHSSQPVTDIVHPFYALLLNTLEQGLPVLVH